MALLEDEKGQQSRRTARMTYAYRPEEAAWVDAWVLSDQEFKERRIAGFRRMLKEEWHTGARQEGASEADFGHAADHQGGTN